MAEVATAEFLSHLESLYPAQPAGSISPWSFVVAVAFSASNLPEAVPLVFQHAVKDLTSDTDRLLLARKLKDAIFKSGMLSGYPKAINAIGELHAVLPDKLREQTPLRELFTSTEDLTRIGQDFFSQTYGDTAETVQGFLREIYPDLEHFSTTFAYGYTYSFSQVLTHAETSFAMVAALIATDTPRQIDWHLKGAMRNNATRAEVLAVRTISIEVSKSAVFEIIKRYWGQAPTVIVARPITEKCLTYSKSHWVHWFRLTATIIDGCRVTDIGQPLIWLSDLCHNCKSSMPLLKLKKI